MNQGQEATRSGSWLETAVEQAFRDYGFEVVDHAENNGNLDLLSDKLLIRQVPYTSIYGTLARSDFLAVWHSRQQRVRFECRLQNVSGSCDEKLPYMLSNAIHAMPENDVVLVVDGEGARKCAVDWLKDRAVRCTTKRIAVVNLIEARMWVKRFVEDRAV